MVQTGLRGVRLLARVTRVGFYPTVGMYVVPQIVFPHELFRTCWKRALEGLVFTVSLTMVVIAPIVSKDFPTDWTYK